MGSDIISVYGNGCLIISPTHILNFITSLITLAAVATPQVVYAGETALRPTGIPETIITVVEEPPIPPITTLATLSDELRCNCYLYVQSLVPNLPLMAQTLPNSKIEVGSVAIFMYPNNLKHVAVVTEVYDDHFVVSETNYKKCKAGVRDVLYTDKALLGFWTISSLGLTKK